MPQHFLKNTSCNLLTACAMMAVGLFGAEIAPASASDEYVVINLSEHVGSSEAYAFGINAHGEVVGRIDTGGTSKAFIWLPTAAYGMSAGLNLLDDNFAGFQFSSALDVNDSGVVVGGVLYSPGLRPYVWDLSGSFGSTTIGNSPLLAWDVNNDVEPLIVGGLPQAASLDDIKEVFEPGFLHNLDTGVTTTLAGSTSNDPAALAISDSDPSTGYRIAGLSSCAGCSFDACASAVDGQYWGNTSSASEIEPIGDCTGNSARCVGYAVNNDHLVVGYGNDPADTSPGGDTRRRALVWDAGIASTPTVLPRLDSIDENIAYGLRGSLGSGNVEIVGFSPPANQALAWRQNGSSWDLVELNDVACKAGIVDVLETAFAVNANGWIAGSGESGSDTVAFLLIPIDDYKTNWCAADIANAAATCPDGAVNVSDLLVLLDNWGTAGPGADISDQGPGGSSEVNLFDMLDLLNSWGYCIGGASTPVNSLEDEVTSAGLTMNDWDHFESVMTDSNTAKSVKVNYSCWMKNYLSGCAKCPACPDEDPFD